MAIPLMKSYVYDNVEVSKTGRTASKTLASGKEDVLFEITPVHQTTGMWKKWVRESDLFLIKITNIREDNKDDLS